MSPDLYLAYVAACVLLVVIPGPTVTLIIANSMKYGTRAGLLNIVGTQLGVAVCIAVVLVGLTSLIEAMGVLFDVVRLAGAAYLVWLGWKLLRSSSVFETAEANSLPRGGFVWQGFLVLMSNPKTLVLFGALFPQFIDPQGDYVSQVLLLGGTAMATALLFDSVYAVLSGRAASLLSRHRVRLVSQASGICLIGGGVWLALQRR
jgi:homoserine/homoserine lactone efflux protein